jgi:hypothetical protein
MNIVNISKNYKDLLKHPHGPSKGEFTSPSPPSKGEVCGLIKEGIINWYRVTHFIQVGHSQDRHGSNSLNHGEVP